MHSLCPLFFDPFLPLYVLGVALEAADLCNPQELDHIQHPGVTTWSDALPRLYHPSQENLFRYAQYGIPVILENITHDWPARAKWNHDYFRDLLREDEKNVFASTFASPHTPLLEETLDAFDNPVYFG
jgi:hypothetical protein